MWDDGCNGRSDAGNGLCDHAHACVSDRCMSVPCCMGLYHIPADQNAGVPVHFLSHQLDADFIDPCDLFRYNLSKNIEEKWPNSLKHMFDCAKIEKK